MSSSLNLSDSANTLDFEAGTRPCTCIDDLGIVDKSFMYAEGTQTDTAISDNKTEYSENVWYGIKPTRLFSKDFTPLVTARQIFITRILMDGALINPEEDELKPKLKKEKAMVPMTKKKSAVRFLSQPDLKLE